MTISNESYENEIYENESYENGRCEEEGYTSNELVKLVQSLSARLNKLKADCVRCSFEESTEDFLVLGEYVLGIPSHDGEVDDCIVIEVVDSTPDAISILDSSE